MSDFDKEAEREKLREKFEKEEDNRAATEQMSELLLKGATMTNAHCSECGDPIFRYDGQEFCPTCQKPVARDTQANGADPSDADEQEGQVDDGDQIEVADPSGEAHVQFGDADEEAAESVADATDEPAQQETAHTQADAASHSPSEPASSTSDSAAPPEAGGNQPTQQSSHSEPAPQTARTGVSSEPSSRTANDQPRGTSSQNPPVSARQTQSTDSHTDDIAANMDAASALLAETAHRFAERAAATENPREAREHLQAAREAAEALDAARF
ncbi:Sjogren's syndrome/scleroderma autoantigen 1 family protein [Haloarcula sp. NS06]|uniref:Sjogren's syndrome/scleroderma autoantigen 1 family protein n=1 Tax=unclassified Haloarcula TaxID=2624677 RepID=UPI0027B822C4|nr:Sjogren's syndrome/scleroderma autoantigen 1 family protein [Haloarcula sp. H-GB4]MDQ2073843.1 Sjogren's syndrome/scleroderma autoantigen 1 family protein [Haloarcula sp. H-GB4]